MKKLVAWVLGVPAALFVVAGAVAFAWISWQGRLRAPDTFGDLRLGAPSADVRFIKGPPTGDGTTKERWVYKAGTHPGIGGAEAALYVVMFRDDKVRYVLYTSTPGQVYHPMLHSFQMHGSYDEILAKLGPPSTISVSADGLQRVIHYDQYRSFFVFARAQVRAYGVYDPALGPVGVDVLAPPVVLR